MAHFPRIIATLWLLVQLTGAIPRPELQPIPRSLWDGTSEPNLSTREVVQAAAVAAIKPVDKEEFFWASTDKPGSKAVVVSLVSLSKASERIISLDKIDFLIQSASCNAKDMSFKFIHPFVYAAVKIYWDWVNFNDMNTFVVIPNSKKCGKDREQNPWIARRVIFDDKNQRVRLEATKSTWKKVMQTYTLDFGEVILGSKGLVKRDIIPDLNEKFRLGIGATLPTRIFGWEVNKGPLKGNLTANCNSCGTQGALVFAGHVEASLGWTGFDIDKFEISVKPEGVGVNLELELLFDAHLDFRRFVKPSQEIKLVEIPISGWNIPGIFEFGPRIQLNAGYEISYISGTASATAGISARIPDSAIAKLDLLSKNSVQVSGWAPVVETQPLRVQAQVDAEASVYTEVALSVSITVLDDNGFGVDLALKVPKVTATLGAGFDTAGFCPNKANIFGIKLDVMVGADLDLEGWREIDGKRKTLFNVDIFEKPDIFVFPQLCLGFDDVAPGYCLGGKKEEDDEDDDNHPGHYVRGRRARIPGTLSPPVSRRQDPDTGRNPIPMKCDKKKTVQILKYPSPVDLSKDTRVPIFVPDIPCGEASEDCWPNANISVITVPLEQRAIVDQTGLLDQEKWASEHVYEANWVRDYLDFLQKKLTGSVNGPCHAAVVRFWDKLNPTYPAPGGAPAKASYVEALAQHLGTVNTAYEPRMAIIQQRLNNLKYLMFAEKSLIAGRDGVEGRRKVINNHGRFVCELARISATCKYFAHSAAQEALKKSILGIEEVLGIADKDNKMKEAGISFQQVHKDFYQQFHDAAIKWTRDQLQTYAKFLLEDPIGMDELPPGFKEELQRIRDDGEYRKDLCPQTKRTGW
ncbi:hypothetical protein, variant [Blastomyces dermatitidis ATCC 18188]|uniref:Uncharacterized protein n=1 Tax=Ajellomyces dermatitidis (strain ATCC 18188 / CBS 674.68) TaxID=653446 RepID=F2T5G6_AJEDA|nr:hypothetical protein BDDG_01328 [Blastomyces dermatitidis ATCC 18188]KMW66725.1 hypothetical protein, variant [Blastomyces dermatitidis ATCC 18188]